MPQVCSICTNPRGWEITRALCAGDTIRPLASRFKVTSAAVMRHRKNCLRLSGTQKNGSAGAQEDLPAKTVALRPATDARSIIERADVLLSRAEGVLTRAEGANDDLLALKAVREAKSVLEMLARIHGLLQPDGVSVTIDARKQTAILQDLSDDELRAIIAAGRALPQAKPC